MTVSGMYKGSYTLINFEKGILEFILTTDCQVLAHNTNNDY